MTIIYLLAMVALGLHLAHGIFSAQQTLGWTGTPAGLPPRQDHRARARPPSSPVGFIIPPLAILFGLIK